MRSAIDPRNLTAQAEAGADAAARRSGLTLRELEDLESLKRASSLLDSVWAVTDGDSMISAEMMRALSVAGSYLVAAFIEERMVGMIVGFLGMHDGRSSLHSHILGVLPEAQGHNVGFALKQNQRAWALHRGITEVQWTFDPLVRRNAYFNITKLGAKAAKYLPNFYGTMRDGINAGDESDRLLVSWFLDSEEAIEASEGRYDQPETEELIATGAIRALSKSSNGVPVENTQEAPTLLCAVPNDIVALRSTNRTQAAQWRQALRRTLGGRLDEGYAVSGFSKNGYYILTRGEPA